MDSSSSYQGNMQEAWAELKQNPGRSILQSLGLILGVASVLGGFSISDSQRRRSEQFFAKMGGLDKLTVYPIVLPERPTALQNANLGLRSEDALLGAELPPSAGLSFQRQASVYIRSSHADQQGDVLGVHADFIPMNGYAIKEGRPFSASDYDSGAPVAILGSHAAETFFPAGKAVGQSLSLGAVPVTIIGVFQERIFRLSESGENVFSGKNQILAAPALFVQKRLQQDSHRRVDEISFRVPDISALQGFSMKLTSLLKSSHRLQEDFRLDDMGNRLRKAQKQEEVYDLIFLLSGVLALAGGGIVNVNIQMASLKERVREVGLKMALGATDREIFRGFLTEALLLTAFGGLVGLAFGVIFSWTVTQILEIQLHMRVSSFLWAFLMAGVSGFLFALFPAWKASRLSPMEALRYE